MRRAALVAAAAVAVALAGLGAHWTVRALGAGAQTTSPSAQSAPAVAQSAPTVAQSAPTKDEIGDEVQTVPRGRLPAFAADADTAALYRFATTRGDVLGFMPCTCGCARLGHTSNRSCYIKAETEAAVTYTSHAAT